MFNANVELCEPFDASGNISYIIMQLIIWSGLTQKADCFGNWVGFFSFWLYE